jgi:acetyl-CoA carboxylase biotin carboxyl carrier protein
MNGRNRSYKERSADREVEEAEEQAQKGVVLASMKRIVSNMAGVVLEFLVKPGEKIVIDQDVIMLESMKMQIPVQSTVEGTVRVIKVNEGDFVDDGDVLLEVE